MYSIIRKTIIATLVLQVFSSTAEATSIGNARKIVTKNNVAGLNQIQIATDNGSILEITLLRPDLFRAQAGVDGKLLDSGDKAAPIVIKKDYGKVAYQLIDQTDYQLLQTSAMALRLYKKPLRMALFRADNKTPIWQEAQALELGAKASFQTLSSSPDEHFLGGGQQNGSYAFTGKLMEIFTLAVGKRAIDQVQHRSI